MRECANCGTENGEGARFCSACGGPLWTNAVSVRKTVTVLFCDLVGSTAMGDGADPEVLRTQMTNYHAQVRAVLERHGGTVEKFIGDAAMAVFGLPSAHEDDALRAVRAAVEARDSVSRLGFSVRIGINTGEVVAGEGETLVTGDAVNVAARLEQAAGVGEILIGELTERLARDAIRSDPREPLSLKGKAAPVPSYRVLEVEGEALAARPSDAPFVGREEELEKLRRAVSLAMTERQPQLATIVGPPGIGKSRLVRELTRNTGTRVVHGRCLSYGQGITYWPLQQIVEQIGDVRAVLGEGEDATLAAARIDAALGAGAASSDEIAWGFRKLLEALAATEPLIVIVDDIHWAEPTLLDLLEYLADFSRDAALLLLCTARPELLDSRPSWTAPRTNAVLVALEPLPAEQVETLIDELGDISGGYRERLIAAAEGNPLFIEQLVAMSSDLGPGSGRIEIPPTIQALLTARIDRLAPEERTVMERGAVEGRLFHRGSVRELVPEPARPEVGRSLLSLVRRQFIRPDRAEFPGDDAFRFDHVLIRDAAYESLPKEVRAELHERFAAWLEERLGPNALDEIVAYHLEQAVQYRTQLGLPIGDVAGRAAHKLARAARTASARGDVHAQVNFLERAAALLPDGDATRPGVLANLGTALVKSGQEGRAVECLGEAEALAREIGDARSEWLARLERRPIETLRDPEGMAESLMSEGEAAITALPDDHEVVARAWQLIGAAHAFRGQMLENFRANQTALEHARLIDDPTLETDIVMNSGGPIALGPIPVEEGFRWVSDVLETTRNRTALEGWRQHMLGHLRARLGEVDVAVLTIDAWRAHLRELGHENQYLTTALCAWDVRSLAQDWSGGEEVLREAEEALERAGETGYRSTVTAHLSQALFEQGLLDEADRYSHLSEQLGASDDVDTQGAWRRVRARVLASRGQTELAIALARESVRIYAETDFLDEHAQALLDLAWVMRKSGDSNAAEAAVRDAVALYRQKGNLVAAARAQALLATP